MKRKRVLKTLYILAVLSVFLPWFTYNPDVMGYCWGYAFLGRLLLPLAVIGIYLFGKRSHLMLLLSELSLIVSLSVLVVAFGQWQEVCNIQPGFHWADGFKTAQIGYWISLGLFVTMFSWFQIDLMISALRKNRSID